MLSLERRVAVVGCGFCGLCAMKGLKEENIEPVGFEKAPYYGGTWRYHDDDVEGLPSVMSTTVINNSKEMGAFSNFPPPKEYPNYMSHEQMYSFITAMCEKFDLLRHIKLNHEVISVKPSDDYLETGRWIVTVRNNETGDSFSDTFDGVMVAIGQFTYPNTPEFPGMENFKGNVIHTHSLKRVDEFKNKKVAVIGLGCSALDAAVEISNVTKQVYLSTRTGGWILPRMGPFGMPVDFLGFRRFVFFFLKLFPVKVFSRLVENLILNVKFDHHLYNLNPTHHVMGKDPAVSDFLPCKIITGAVVMKKGIEKFTEQGVVFEGDDKATELDTVVLATGYTWQFPFLDEDIVTTKEGRINLYKCMFPPHLPHPTLAIIGFLLSWGAGFPLGEAQGRWAALLMNRKLSLPTRDEMLADIKAKHEENIKRYLPSEKTTLRVDYIAYLDDLTSQFGAKPNLIKMAFTDPKLFIACVFGASVPYQYRLQGPHPWPGARDAILTAHDRMRTPLSHTPKRKPINYLGFLVKHSIFVLLFSMFFSWKELIVKGSLALVFLPYLMSWKGMCWKYFFSLLMLPFFATGQDFLTNYLLIFFLPLLTAVLISL